MTAINLVIFGIGNVGSTLIKQIDNFKTNVAFDEHLKIKVPIIANSKLAIFKDDISSEWKIDFDTFSTVYSIEAIIKYIHKLKLKNVIAVDATASQSFVQHYPNLINNGFHIVAANKAANTLSFQFYTTIRQLLKTHNKTFNYETNVGAALPIIETVSNLKRSGEQVKKVRGVFSGSLSYIFNRFSEEPINFSKILTEASAIGLTEPDSRDDLSGKDVARKLLILARELGLQKNLEAVNIESLVPKQLNGNTSLKQFNCRISELDNTFQEKKAKTSKDEVLRYVGELDVSTQKMSVKLISTSKQTPLGQLKGTDNLFEIYTESYKKHPLVIQGAGAGKEVTARGLLTDILKIAKTLK